MDIGKEARSARINFPRPIAKREVIDLLDYLPGRLSAGNKGINYSLYGEEKYTGVLSVTGSICEGNPCGSFASVPCGADAHFVSGIQFGRNIKGDEEVAQLQEEVRKAVGEYFDKKDLKKKLAK
jgi:hypothetical protein